jgi:Na+/glutamate symporter
MLWIGILIGIPLGAVLVHAHKVMSYNDRDDNDNDVEGEDDDV